MYVCCNTSISYKILAVLLRIQLPLNVHGQAAEDAPGSWTPANAEEDPGGVSDSDLWSDPYVAVTTTRRVNQWIKAIPSHCHPASYCLASEIK